MIQLHLRLPRLIAATQIQLLLTKLTAGVMTHIAVAVAVLDSRHASLHGVLHGVNSCVLDAVLHLVSCRPQGQGAPQDMRQSICKQLQPRGCSNLGRSINQTSNEQTATGRVNSEAYPRHPPCPSSPSLTSVLGLDLTGLVLSQGQGVLRLRLQIGRVRTCGGGTGEYSLHET